MRLVAEDVSGERGGEMLFWGLSFALGAGESLTVTGENGSGKSTLLRILAGLIAPAAGQVRIEGAASVAGAAHYLGHDNAMKPALTVAENLAFWRDFQDEPKASVDEALEMIELPKIGHLPFGYLSTGQRRRIAIARLLVSRRPVWLLDEPTAGLDARAERQFGALMQAHLDEGGIIVAATHVELGLDGEELVMGGRG